MVVLLVLGVTAFLAQPELLLADPLATLRALGFAAVVVVVTAGGLLWADRRWPQRPERPDE